LVERYLPSDLRYNRLEPNRHKKIKRWYRDYNTSVDQQLSNYTRISHTQHYLNSKGITNYNFTCETYEYTNIPTWFDSSTLKSIDVDALSTQYGRADDNIHPSELGHSHIAEIMYKHITK
jgi:lysophospholipase L1-like esterase